jgi:hypothetical protein
VDTSKERWFEAEVHHIAGESRSDASSIIEPIVLRSDVGTA